MWSPISIISWERSFCPVDIGLYKIKPRQGNPSRGFFSPILLSYSSFAFFFATGFLGAAFLGAGFGAAFFGRVLLSTVNAGINLFSYLTFSYGVCASFSGKDLTISGIPVITVTN